jgi:signal transduction histidine kinase
MSPVALIDIAGAVAFLVALVVVALVPSDTPGLGRGTKYPLLIAIGLYLFVGLSNAGEHSGLIDALDAYEDYAELMFIPVIAYIIYGRSSVEQLEVAERAQRQARAEHALLTSIVNTTPVGILVAGAGGDVSLVNEEARRILELGVRPGSAQEPLEGVADGPAAAGAIRGLDLAAIVRSAPTGDRLHALGSGDGTVWVSARATTLGPAQGPDARAVIALEDVTSRIRSEIELEHYREDLERLVDRRTAELIEVNRELRSANEAAQRFLANVSHELRTPLNAIIGFTALLLQELPGPVNEEQRRQLGMVSDSGQQLLSLVNDVLDLARIEAGHSPVELAAFDLGSHIRAVVAPLSTVADGRSVRLECVCADGPALMSDADKLGQIVRNLVSNAIKFTGPGGSVRVGVARDGDGAVVEVIDTGIGISLADQERIFEAFVQVDSPDHSKPPGAGLGLAICRELCDLLGLRLTVASALGEGSTFRVHVPAGQFVA